MTKEAITPEPILQTVAGLWAAGVLIRRSFSSAGLRQMLMECGASHTEVDRGLPVGFVLGYRD